MTEEERILSTVAVTVQASGALLLALTLSYLSRLFGRPHAAYWGGAWIALSASLLSVRGYITSGGRGWWVVYLLAEWAFLLLLLAGCRALVGASRIRPRLVLAGAPAAVLVAYGVSRLPRDFNGLFAGQAAVVALTFLACFATIGDARDRGSGWRLMRFALAALGVLFAVYVPVFGGLVPLESDVLGYSSVLDLLGETLLGFGMVLFLSEETQLDLQRAVADLRRMRDELEVTARVDPLTEVFNRHAFRSIADDPAGRAGTAIMLDVDGLKRINDTDGHPAGDVAIRAAARAIRGLIRPEDLLFRWGGDEFLVLLPNVDEETAHARFAALDEGIAFDMDGSPRRLSLSWGAARFGDGIPIARAISSADEAMYGRRAAARAAESSPRAPAPNYP